jgi:hypothetical protein
MKVKEAATRIEISESLIYELCRLGVLRHSRHGRPGKRGCIRIADDAVAEYLAETERQSWRDEAPLKHIR